AARQSKRDFRRAHAPVLAQHLAPAQRKDRLRQLKQAQELGIVWRMLLGVTGPERFSLELTALADAALAVAWLLALEAAAGAYGLPRDEAGRMIPAAVIGIGKFGGRELTAGSDLDLFVVYGGAGWT